MRKFYKYTFNGAITIINPARIMYAYSDKRVCTVVMRTGMKHSFFKKLDDLEQELAELAPMMFTRAGKSFLVNNHFVESYTTREVVMVNGEHIGITKSHTSEFREKYQEWESA